MTKNKSKLVKKIVIGAGLCLLPVVSNSQSIKEDINWTKIKEPYGKYTLTIRSINPLPELSKYKSNPTRYLPHGNLNLGYNNTYTIPQDSIKGEVSKYLKKIDVCPDCTKPKRTNSTKKISTKKAPTPTKPIQSQKIVVPQPNKLEKKVETLDTLKKELQRETGVNYNFSETNITNNTTYNITPQEVKAAADTAVKKSKENYLSLRALLEGNKKANPITSSYGGVSGAIQLGNDSFWGGFYGTWGIGKEKEIVTTAVENETLLNQNLQLYTGTKGTRTESSELTYPIEFGGLVSINSKNNRVRLDLGYGFAKKLISTSGISESGTDYMRQGNKIIEEKPYSIELEKGRTYENWIHTQKASLNVELLKGFYAGVEAQHRGKVDSKMKGVNFNIKAGMRFGGSRKK